MSYKRISIRFNLEDPEDKRAWDSVQELSGGSKNREIIRMINDARRSRDIQNLIVQTITTFLKGTTIHSMEVKKPVNDDMAALSLMDSF